MTYIILHILTMYAIYTVDILTYTTHTANRACLSSLVRRLRTYLHLLTLCLLVWTWNRVPCFPTCAVSPVNLGRWPLPTISMPCKKAQIRAYTNVIHCMYWWHNIKHILTTHIAHTNDICCIYWWHMLSILATYEASAPANSQRKLASR